MCNPDDVWCLILDRHGPLDLVTDPVLRERLAAKRVQRAWRDARPRVGDRMAVRLGRAGEEWGTIVNVYPSHGPRRFLTVRVPVRNTLQSRTVFVARHNFWKRGSSSSSASNPLRPGRKSEPQR